MNFKKKFILLVLAIFIMVILQVYVNNLEPININFMGYKLQIGVYTLCALVLVKWLLKVIIRAICKIWVKLFFRNHDLEEKKSITKLAQMIMLDINKFPDLKIVEKFKPIEVAIMLKNNIKVPYIIGKTDIKEIDIYLIKNEITEHIKNHHYNLAISLVQKVIKENCKNINIVQNEILELAKQSKMNKFAFTFDPNKSKYKLDNKFIEKYYVELGLLDFSITQDGNVKIHILEKLHKIFPKNIRITQQLLKFKRGSEAINLIKCLFILKPDRHLSYDLINIYNKNDILENNVLENNILKNDIFEIAQEMLQTVQDDNIEKIWFLLVIATKMKYFSKIKELIKKIKSEPLELARFYVDNYNILSQDQEIVKIIGKN